MNFFLSALIGALTGILSGFGIGGGTLLIIAMTTFSGASQITAQGVNLLYFLPAAGASLIGHIKNRLIDREAFLWTALPGTLATAASSIFLGTLDAAWVRRLFGAFLLVIGVSELFRRPKS